MEADRRNVLPASGAGVQKPGAKPTIPALREGNSIGYTEGPDMEGEIIL